jgi:bacterioferritin
MSQGPFVKDIEAIRRRAREHLDKGAVTKNYGADLDTAIKLLNEALATEIVCVLRYKYHAVMATGIASESVKAEFTQHATEEMQHADWLAERINQLGGKPNMNPEGLLSRATAQYVEGETLVDMIRENLVAERIAIEVYRDMIAWFGDGDSTTRIMLERILEAEEEHANDMHDLLEAHDRTQEQQVQSMEKQGAQVLGGEGSSPAIRQVPAGPVSGRAGGVATNGNGPQSRH